MNLFTLCARYLFVFCFLVACNITTAGEKKRCVTGNLLTLPGIIEEPSLANSLSPSPNKSIEPSILTSSVSPTQNELPEAATPKSFSVSITVKNPDNPGDKGFRFSAEELANLVQLIPSGSSRATIRQLIPTIVIDDEANVVNNASIQNESADTSLRRCSFLCSLCSFFGARTSATRS